MDRGAVAAAEYAPGRSGDFTRCFSEHASFLIEDDLQDAGAPIIRCVYELLVDHGWMDPIEILFVLVGHDRLRRDVIPHGIIKRSVPIFDAGRFTPILHQPDRVFPRIVIRQFGHGSLLRCFSQKRPLPILSEPYKEAQPILVRHPSCYWLRLTPRCGSPPGEATTQDAAGPLTEAVDPTSHP
jgi:hypothetical protein